MKILIKSFYLFAWLIWPVAVSGESAGACTALWLACSPDLAKTDSFDQVDCESTRVRAVGVTGAQTSLDPKQMREWVGPELAYGGHAFGLAESDFALFLKKRSEFKKYFGTVSTAALLSADDCPVYLYYKQTPDELNKDHDYYVHSPGFGFGFQKLVKSRGVTSYLAWPGHKDEGFKGDVVDFIIEKLR